MALTAEDRKRLNNKQQQQIQIATTQYNRAKEKGDTAGMAKAAADAAAVRKSAGYYTDSSGNYKGSYSGGGSSGGSSYSGGSSGSKNSPYTENNYTIGSDYGKYIAQNYMGIGDTYEATDGSFWRKENDGTITVTHNGQTYKNAYKPTDLGILGKQQVEAGLDKDIVKQTYYDRLDKISKDPTLSAYMYDGTMQMLYDYIYGQEVDENYEENLDKLNEGRPDEYNNPYKKEIDFLLNQILNRDDFSYDAANDPLYQQYRDMYNRESDRAVQNTIAEAAAGAGGMNTYAITAAQQAANYYNSQLNDKIPELYYAAYDMHLKDIDNKVRDLGLLENMDATQYSRYRDTMSDWKDDRNFALGVYKDAVAQGNWEKTFDYNSMLGNRDFGYNDFWNNKQWEHDIGREQIEDTRYDANISKEDEDRAYNRIMDLIASGVTTIDPALIKTAGLTEEAVKQMITRAQAEWANKNKPSGSDSDYTGSKTTDKTKDKTTEDDDAGYIPKTTDDTPTADEDTSYLKGFDDLGLGRHNNAQLLVTLQNAGAIYEKGDKLYWNEGWNANNYLERLEVAKKFNPTLYFNPLMN